MISDKFIPTATYAALESSMMSRHGAVVFTSSNKPIATGFNNIRSRTLNKIRTSEHAEVSALRRAINTKRGGKQSCLRGKVATCC